MTEPVWIAVFGGLASVILILIGLGVADVRSRMSKQESQIERLVSWSASVMALAVALHPDKAEMIVEVMKSVSSGD